MENRGCQEVIDNNNDYPTTLDVLKSMEENVKYLKKKDNTKELEAIKTDVAAIKSDVSVIFYLAWAILIIVFLTH